VTDIPVAGTVARGLLAADLIQATPSIGCLTVRLRPSFQRTKATSVSLEVGPEASARSHQDCSLKFSGVPIAVRPDSGPRCTLNSKWMHVCRARLGTRKRHKACGTRYRAATHGYAALVRSSQGCIFSPYDVSAPRSLQ
jgi:hypothetical protein